MTDDGKDHSFEDEMEGFLRTSPTEPGWAVKKRELLERLSEARLLRIRKKENRDIAMEAIRLWFGCENQVTDEYMHKWIEVVEMIRERLEAYE